MFDAPRLVAARGDADRGGAVLIGPANPGGRMGFRHHPVKAIGMRAKDQRRALHRVHAARHSVAQRVGPLRPAIVEDVVALLIQYREMGVQAGAGVILIRFRHKACGKAVPPCQTLDQHLEQPCVIGGAQRIVTMHEVDLELAQTRLGNGGVGGDVHLFAGVIKIGEEQIELVERADRHRLGRFAPLARPGGDGHLKVAARIVDQEEFQLNGTDRRQPARLVAVEHRAQRMARIAGVGAAIFAEHPDRQQGRGRVEPRHRHEAPLGRFQHAIRIARFEHQRTVVDILAPDVEVQH